MAKLKYRYNPESLSYDIIITSAKEKLKKWGIMFASSIVIAIIYYSIYSYFYDTPRERILTNNLSNLKFNYQMLSQDLNQIDYILSDIQKRDDNIYRTVLESEPIPNSIRQAGFGGVNRYEPLEGYLNSNLMIGATKHTDRILKQLYVQSISYDELIDRAINIEQMTASRPAIQPIAKKDLKHLYTKFGMRFNPVVKRWMNHTGLDFSADFGKPVYVTGDGTVVKAEYNKGGYGNVIDVDHGFGYMTRYAHLQTMRVQAGDEVKRGHVIATVGSTGRSEGPHLHYEVRKNGIPVNPIHYFYNDMSDTAYFEFVEQVQNSEGTFEDWETTDDDVPDDNEL